MFISGHFGDLLSGLIDITFNAVYLLLIAKIFLSWVNPDPYNPIVEFIYKVTEPILGPVRRIIPLQVGMIDLSPIVVFIALGFLRQLIHHLVGL